MSLDDDLLKLKERLDLELRNSDPQRKGCFGTLVYSETDIVCNNCLDCFECGNLSSKNRMSILSIIENELGSFDRSLASKKYEYDDEEIVSLFDWAKIVIEFTKLKPASFSSAVEFYLKYMSSDSEIDIHGRHKILAIRAEVYVSRVLNGLEDHGYLVWDIANENKILWVK